MCSSATFGLLALRAKALWHLGGVSLGWMWPITTSSLFSPPLELSSARHLCVSSRAVSGVFSPSQSRVLQSSSHSSFTRSFTPLPLLPLHFRSRTCARCCPRASHAPLPAARPSPHLGCASTPASRHQSCLTLPATHPLKHSTVYCSK